LTGPKGIAVSRTVVEKAKALGASLAGICNVEELKKGPSANLAPGLAKTQIGSRDSPLGLGPGEVFWPPSARTAVVIAYAHPERHPELDWWASDTDSPGNKRLRQISRMLADWLRQELACAAVPLPYHVEEGGVFLKDAAVLAGLGSIGRNNLLITPQYGPRVRLRALLLSVQLAPTGPEGYDPCACCSAPCLDVCPTAAYARRIFSPDDTGLDALPALGFYDRDRCHQQMVADVETARTSSPPVVKYCRRCELACPVGVGR